MALLSPRRIAEVTDALSRRAQRVHSTLALVLSPDEFISAFIQPDHIEALNKVREIVGQVGGWYANSVVKSGENQMRVMINFVNSAPILLPQYIANGVQPKAHADVLSKIQLWADQRIHYGALFGDAVDGLNWLNTNASDLRAMRAMFPALPILLKDINSDEKSPTSKMALRLDTNKAVGNLPRLPREVALRLLEASQFISSTTLFDATQLEDDKKYPSGSAKFSREGGASVKRPNIFYPDGTVNASFV